MKNKPTLVNQWGDPGFGQSTVAERCRIREMDHMGYKEFLNGEPFVKFFMMRAVQAAFEESGMTKTEMQKAIRTSATAMQNILGGGGNIGNLRNFFKFCGYRLEFVVVKDESGC